MVLEAVASMASSRKSERASICRSGSVSIVVAALSGFALINSARAFTVPSSLLPHAHSLLPLAAGGRHAAASVAPAGAILSRRLSHGGVVGWDGGRAEGGEMVGVACRAAGDRSQGGPDESKKRGGLIKLRDESVKVMTKITNLTITVLR